MMPEPEIVNTDSGAEPADKPVEEQKVEKPSIFQRFIESFKSSRFYNAMSAASGYVAARSTAVSTRLNANPIYKKTKSFISAATAGMPLLSIAMYSLTIAGVVSPFGPAIAVAVGTVGLAGVLINAAMETIEARNFRKLQKEHAALDAFVNVKHKQHEVIERNSRLAKALDLKKDFDTTSAKVNDRHKSTRWDKVKSFLWSVAKNTAEMIVDMTQMSVISTVKIVSKLVKAAVFVAIDSKHVASVWDKSLEYKKHIAEAQEKFGLMDYKDLKDLNGKINDEKVVLRALEIMEEKLKNEPNLSDEEIKEQYEEAKKIAKSESDGQKNNMGKVSDAIGNFIDSLIHAHNPFSAYLNPADVKIKAIGTNQVGDIIRAVDQPRSKNNDSEKQAVADALRENLESDESSLTSIPPRLKEKAVQNNGRC